MLPTEEKSFGRDLIKKKNYPGTGWDALQQGENGWSNALHGFCLITAGFPHDPKAGWSALGILLVVPNFLPLVFQLLRSQGSWEH